MLGVIGAVEGVCRAQANGIRFYSGSGERKRVVDHNLGPEIFARGDESLVSGIVFALVGVVRLLGVKSDDDLIAEAVIDDFSWRASRFSEPERADVLRVGEFFDLVEEGLMLGIGEVIFEPEVDDMRKCCVHGFSFCHGNAVLARRFVSVCWKSVAGGFRKWA